MAEKWVGFLWKSKEDKNNFYFKKIDFRTLTWQWQPLTEIKLFNKTGKRYCKFSIISFFWYDKISLIDNEMKCINTNGSFPITIDDPDANYIVYCFLTQEEKDMIKLALEL